MYKLDEYVILDYALRWFADHDAEHPVCTCGSTQPSTLCTGTHKRDCPVAVFTRKGYEYGADRFMELQTDGS